MVEWQVNSTLDEISLLNLQDEAKTSQSTYTSLFVVYFPYSSDSYAVHLTGNRPWQLKKKKQNGLYLIVLW